MFQSLDNWWTTFTVDGVKVGGHSDPNDDWRLFWTLEAVGGARDKRILELGSFEGGHTKFLLDRGAREVVGIEGFRPAWLRSLVVKEIFGLEAARLLYGDFCDYVGSYTGDPYDLVLAFGVLYHQRNPAQLIRDLAGVTNRVLVWSQVADKTSPPGEETTVTAGDAAYRGRVNHYGNTRDTSPDYCGGVHPSAVWLYPDEQLRAFTDAGFAFVAKHPDHRTDHGPAMLYAASKHDDLEQPQWKHDVK